MNVAWQQQKMVQFCKEKKIHVSAYSPLGANGAFWGSLAVMESPILKHVAASTNKTIAQVGVYKTVHLTLLSVKKVLCTIRGKLQDCDEHVFPQSEFIEA